MKKRITFIGSFYPDMATQELLNDTKSNLDFAGDTFQKALLKGFSSQLDVRAISAILIGSYPNRFKILSTSKYSKYNTENITFVGFINLTIYKVISKFMNVYRTLKTMDLCDNEKVVVYSMDLSFLLAVLLLKKKHPNIHIHLIIADIMEFCTTHRFRLFLNKILQKVFLSYINKVDSFTLMTPYMKEKLKIIKNCTIIEGIYDGLRCVHEYKKKKKCFTIFYSGTLDRRYGINHLLNAFSMIEIKKNIELWICGDGDARNDVIEASLKDQRIIYKGLISRDEVLLLQEEANLLINPRFSTDEYTLYSFPSKTIEYMVSGTPVLMHPLPGIPNEYFDYIFLSYDETDKGFASAISLISEKSEEELKKFGLSARQFIIENKDAVSQAKKIMDIIQ